jgi:DNA repair exonuclease SbcCD ATPase subunit
MSIILKRVTLKNFRSYTDADVSFPENGLTTVVGPNGAGKSTLFAGLFFALYGKAPLGVALKDLRKQGVDLSESTVVTVHLDIDGRDIVVTRSMKGKNNTSMADITDGDGASLTDTKAGAAIIFIEQLIGPAEVFTTAFLVQQQSLNSLVRASGADRRKLIERMSGVEKLKNAVDEARLQVRLAKAAHDAFPKIDMDALRAIESATQSTLDDAVNTLTSTTQLLADAERDVANKNAHITRVEQVARGSLQRRVEWSRLATEVTQATRMVTAAEKALADAESHVPTLMEEPEAPTDISPLREKLSTLREVKASLATRIAGLPETVDFSVAEALTVELAEYTDPVGDFVNVTLLTEQVNALTAQKNHLAGRLESLNDTCPTCNQPIADISNIRDSLITELGAVRTKLRLVAGEHELAVAHNASVTACRELTSRLEVAQAQANQQAALIAERDSLVTELEDVQSDGEELRAQISSVEDINTALETAWKVFHAAAVSVEVRDTAQLTLDDRLAVLKAATSALDAFGKEPVVNENELEDAQLQYQRAVDTLNNAKAKHLEATRIHQDADRTHRDTIHSLETGEQRENIRNTAADTFRIATEVADGVAAFRETRLAALVPTLTESASDHISALSQGRFIAMELTNDFEPSLVDARGGIRNVSMLSGGEENLCALALRLAIGDEVSDSADGSVLMLDEILGAMDADRRDSIVAGLRSLNRQVILVDHHGTPGDHTIDVSTL